MKCNFTSFLLYYKWALCLLLLLSMGRANAQNTGRVTGTVVDSTENFPLPGVSVMIKGSRQGVSTDGSGKFSFETSEPGLVLVFSFVGYKRQEVYVEKGKSTLVRLPSSANTMQEVAVVAYGTQKKSSLVASITTIDPKELKGPTSNLTTMLAGRLSGVIGYQRTGEPGADNAQFFIRGVTSFGTGKVDPLILIDGMESSATDLARLQPDDISAFSVLKDATAASLYGARGANGVLLITTKSGKEGKTNFNIRFENSLSSNTRNFDFADNITYMNLANEARVARQNDAELVYSREKIDGTMAGLDPLKYPSNNWLDQMIKDYTNNQRLNMSLSGGGKTAQYYVSGTYNVDNGVLKVADMNNFNSNIKLKNYSIRSNVNIQLTSSSQLIVRTYGQFDDYNGPVDGGADLFEQALKANPVAFPIMYPSSYAPRLKHYLFGSAEYVKGVNYANPFANAVRGYKQYSSSSINAQVEFKQDFRFITKGLSARMMAYTDRNSYFDVIRQYDPFLYTATRNVVTGDPLLVNLHEGREYLNYTPGDKTVVTTGYIEAAVNYNRTFGKDHSLSAMVIGLQQGILNANGNDPDTRQPSLQASLPKRNQGVSGRMTYGFRDKYLAEFNFGYNGSERFSQNHRFGFFPSAGLAWNIYNEKFFEGLRNTITRLKLRGTYGLVGNDQIGKDSERFFYLSNVNLNDPGKSATFGEDFNYSQSGVSVQRYSNTDITWEQSRKANVGLDIEFNNSLSFVIDAFRERRSNILMERSTLPNTMGLNAIPKANVGVAEGKGAEVQFNYNKTFNRNVWLQGMGTFTFAASKLLENEEPDYPEAYRSKVGYSLSQQWGLIAERLFVDDTEVANSPDQQFGLVRGGDIKYRDVNGDGRIEGNGDQVAIGYPTTPEITYGFGFSMGVKNFDFSAFFQGSARSSIFIENPKIQPFLYDSGFQTGLLREIAESHWSESNRDIYAFWPRLSDQVIQNNQWTSTWWMRNGSFLRLKNVEVGYSLPEKLRKRTGLSNCRLYVNASNLFVISGFDMWDPEMGGNGLSYPVQRVLNFGVNMSF